MNPRIITMNSPACIVCGRTFALPLHLGRHLSASGHGRIFHTAARKLKDLGALKSLSQHRGAHDQRDLQEERARRQVQADVLCAIDAEMRRLTELRRAFA